MFIVCKFGGSSLSSAESVKKVIEIVQSDAARGIVVVSAMGSMYKGQRKITDLLYDVYNGDNEAWAEVAQRYSNLGKELGIDEIDEWIAEAKRNIEEKNSLDCTLSKGEYLMGLMMAKLLCCEFIDGARIVRFCFDKNWDVKGTMSLSKATLKNVKKAVIAGFYGADENGNIVTFSRGGSDITGAIVANAVDADLYENWTDVDGFLAINPKLNDNAELIRCISYSELCELSYYGAEVLHYQTVIPLMFKAIPLNIKNTYNTKADGTMVTYQVTEGVKGMALRNYIMLDIECFDVKKVSKASVEGDKVIEGINGLIILTNRQDAVEQFIATKAITKMRVKDVSVIAVAGCCFKECSEICHTLQNARLYPIALEHKSHSVTIIIEREKSELAANALYEALFK
ncbi:MAG: hypothetical protein RR054_01105 [Clostridia bacterium]